MDSSRRISCERSGAAIPVRTARARRSHLPPRHVMGLALTLDRAGGDHACALVIHRSQSALQVLDSTPTSGEGGLHGHRAVAPLRQTRWTGRHHMLGRDGGSRPRRRRPDLRRVPPEVHLGPFGALLEPVGQRSPHDRRGSSAPGGRATGAVRPGSRSVRRGLRRAAAVTAGPRAAEFWGVSCRCTCRSARADSSGKLADVQKQGERRMRPGPSPQEGDAPAVLTFARGASGQPLPPHPGAGYNGDACRGWGSDGEGAVARSRAGAEDAAAAAARRCARGNAGEKCSLAVAAARRKERVGWAGSVACIWRTGAPSRSR